MSSSVLSHGPTPSVIRPARLSGVSTPLDPRVNAVRPDLADIALAGRVVAPRYAEPVMMRGLAPAAPLYGGPAADGVCVSELLYGEAFAVFDTFADWVWGQCDADRYVGWMHSGYLGADHTPNRRVTASQALLFAAPSIKAPVVMTLPMGARLAVTPHDEIFGSVDRYFIHYRHLETRAGNAVDLACDFLGTPYRWGGRTRAGFDCSGLTQAVLLARGIACPRDSDQQLAAFPAVPFAARRRGDLVGFPGHVGILLDPDTLLHANAYWMTTLTEPLEDVVARLQPLHDKPISGVVRPPCEAVAASL